ncbi:MAG: tRNA (guanosine(46)-N7)-methyltransferase TrmB [Rubrobacter sp.]|jgi:tRNA (guanine-N7-)-methyltransferase|nr:tRNA (guanosine(46)-N7)-methyltransferase TrmB [Rubrobacter sp.]
MTRRKLGRRKVAEPDAATAERYFLRLSGWDIRNDPDSLPRFTSPSLFGNDHPLEMEVGCGSGEFLCHLAEESPETNFVGLDVHLKSLHKGIEAASGAGLGNIKFVGVDFRQAHPLLAPDSLAAVYLHFPDPGMKTREKRRRIFDRKFLDEMHVAVVEGGRMSLVTDDEGYFGQMLALIEADTRWRRTHEEPYLVGFEPGVKSRFQTLWERRGRKVFHFELRNRKSGIRRAEAVPHGS